MFVVVEVLPKRGFDCVLLRLLSGSSAASSRFIVSYLVVLPKSDMLGGVLVNKILLFDVVDVSS